MILWGSTMCKRTKWRSTTFRHTCELESQGPRLKKRLGPIKLRSQTRPDAQGGSRSPWKRRSLYGGTAPTSEVLQSL